MHRRIEAVLAAKEQGPSCDGLLEVPRMRTVTPSRTGPLGLVAKGSDLLS
jgi:hypothetical protein